MAHEVTIGPEGEGWAFAEGGAAIAGGFGSEAEAITAAQIWLEENGGGSLAVADGAGGTRAQVDESGEKDPSRPPG